MKALLWLCLAAGAHAACGPKPPGGDDTGDDAGVDSEPPVCVQHCSADLHQVVDCKDNVVESCAATDACDIEKNTCTNACAAAEANHRSIGCDYYPVHMDHYNPSYCFAVFVANTWTTPAKITVSYDGKPFSAAEVEGFTRLPVGSGPGLSYMAYKTTAGIPPAQVALLFLSGQSTSTVPCPTPAAVPGASTFGTAISKAFHITSDVPVVAYQMSPYGGGNAAVTGGSLLLPASVWETSYVAVNVAEASAGKPSLNIIAKEDGTIATITPITAIQGGGAIPATPAGQPLAIALQQGQHAQLSQTTELTGSIVTSNKPVGFMAGHTCMNMPLTSSFCDHAEQMIPPTRALGHSYVGVMYRPRVAAETSTFWRVIGAVDGTQLTWSSNVGGPATLSKGQSAMFQTGTPFAVSSQDKDHPFMLFEYMTGSRYLQSDYGDPDFVLVVPPEQYLSSYVFMADPTYPETNLVLVRTRGQDQQFHDVTLDCSGIIAGWQPIGSDYQYTHVDLTTGNFAAVGNCSTGRHEIRSTAPFGLWVWGWGTPLTSPATSFVSYGYPGGMNVARINDIIIQ